MPRTPSKGLTFEKLRELARSGAEDALKRLRAEIGVRAVNYFCRSCRFTCRRAHVLWGDNERLGVPSRSEQ